MVTPKDDTLYQVIQRYDTLFGLELTAIDNDTLEALPTYPGYKPYGYVYSIRSLDVVSDADWDEDPPAGTSLNDLIDFKIAQKDDPHYRAPLAERRRGTLSICMFYLMMEVSKRQCFVAFQILSVSLDHEIFFNNKLHRSLAFFGTIVQ